MKGPLTMKLTVEVPDDTIKNVLNEAGSAIAYWALDADRKDDFVLYVKKVDGVGKWHRVGVRRALETMAKKCPKRLGALLAGQYDGETCDLFVQYGCFGEAIYG